MRFHTSVVVKSHTTLETSSFFFIVNAFVMTQDVKHTLTVWTNVDNAQCPRCNGQVEFQKLNMQEVLQSTPLQNHSYFSKNDDILSMKSATSNDVLRLLLLYKYGGVWLDQDALPTKPFDDEILKYPFAPAFDRVSKGMNNHVLALKSMSPLAERFIHTVALHPYNDKTVWFAKSARNITAWIYNDGIGHHIHSHNSLADKENVLHLYDMKLFDPSWTNSSCENAYLIHTRYPKLTRNLNDTLRKKLFDRMTSIFGKPMFPLSGVAVNCHAVMKMLKTFS